MSRHAPLDFEFEKEKFLSLIKKAQGQRTQKAFANDMCISYTYLNRYMKVPPNRPFTPDILFKVLNASEGRVSTEELFIAAGYNPNNYTLNRDKLIFRDFKGDKHTNSNSSFYKNYILKSQEQETKYSSIISNALVNKRIVFYRENDKSKDHDKYVDYSCWLIGQNIVNWGFIYYPLMFSSIDDYKTGIKAKNSFLERVLSYGRDAYYKVSIVVPYDYSDDYTLKKITLPVPTAAIYLSIIKINLETLQVVSEEYIDTLLTRNSEIRDRLISENPELGHPPSLI